MIDILIADDHKVLLDGFISLFKNEEGINVVATAYNGQEVIDKLKETPIDIALLDINMPVINGVETCKLITKRYPKTKVIALSMYKQKSYVKRMKLNGARGYLLKDDSASEIIKAITEVHSGGEYYSHQLQQSDKSKDAPTIFNQDSITTREQEILELIAKGQSNKQIGLLLHISNHTVDSHRKNLLNKFQAKNAAELVKMAIDKGLL